MFLKDFLLRLHLCKGIGIKGENLVYKYFSKIKSSNFRVPDALEIKDIAKINSKHFESFILDYQRLMFENEIVSKLINNEKWIAICDPEYPQQLKESYLPPNVLFYRGNWDLVHTRQLGIVGSRQATEYSVMGIKKLLNYEVYSRITIVSGLAKGVDTLAHQFAIAKNIPTVAVIGTGLNVFYPRENEKLQKIIGKKNLLISEYPDYVRGYRSHFPERNRIIAGLVQSILVTEAKHHSRSLITANLALQNNRNVLAIPGPINSILCQGTNELILAGAKPILTGKDILEEFNI